MSIKMTPRRRYKIDRYLRQLVSSGKVKKLEPSRTMYDCCCDVCGTQMNFRETTDNDGCLAIMIQPCPVCCISGEKTDQA
mgnify:CR=1 FL=1